LHESIAAYEERNNIGGAKKGHQMSVYIVFTRDKTLDPVEFATYQKEVGATFAGHQLKVPVAYGRFEVLEGPDIEGVAILEFPSFEAAKAWYDGPAYRKVREHRFKGAIYRGILVEGVPAPPAVKSSRGRRGSASRRPPKRQKRA
jgi:uncharacterized protein (DUF1330 family)